MAEERPGASWSATAAFFLGIGGLVISGAGVAAAIIGLARDSDPDAYLGISVGLVSILASAPAVVLGAIGLVDVRVHSELRGRNRAVQGLLMGIAGGVLWWVVVLFAVAATA